MIRGWVNLHSEQVKLRKPCGAWITGTVSLTIERGRLTEISPKSGIEKRTKVLTFKM